MNLHHDKEIFQELITGVTNVLHIPSPIIEKDYFFTSLLLNSFYFKFLFKSKLRNGTYI